MINKKIQFFKHGKQVPGQSIWAAGILLTILPDQTAIVHALETGQILPMSLADIVAVPDNKLCLIEVKKALEALHKKILQEYVTRPASDVVELMNVIEKSIADAENAALPAPGL